MKLVHSLQQNVLNSTISVTELLRFAYAIAVKLNLADFQKWLYSEMYGYENADDLPRYRFINGICKYYNPYNGWQDIVTNDLSMLKESNNMSVMQKISELESLSQSEYGISKEFSFSTQLKFAKRFCGMKPVIIIGSQQIIGILDTVRNKILDWALELEQKGILGDEEMSFSEKERVQAQGLTINNYIVGNNTNAPIQQGNNNVMQLKSPNDDNLETIKNLIAEIKNVVEKFNATQQQEIQSEIASIEPQLQSPKPKIEIINIALQSIKNIFEGAVGSYLSSVPSVIDTFNKIKNFISS